MAVPLLLLVLLVVSGGVAGGDPTAVLFHLQLHGIEDSGRGHASDAAPQGQGLMEHLLLTHGCGAYAGLLAATGNAAEIFREHAAAAAGTGGQLTVFCPNNLAVAAFEPEFNKLSADDQLAVVLYHGVTTRYRTEQIAAFDPVPVSTLAADAATNTSHVLTVIYYEEETVWLWPASRGSGSCGAARVTKEVVSGEPTLAVYVIDRVLLPRELQQRLEGGDEPAARTSYGGYLGWLHNTVTVPTWAVLSIVIGSILGFVAGAVISHHRLLLPPKAACGESVMQLSFLRMHDLVFSHV